MSYKSVSPLPTSEGGVGNCVVKINGVVVGSSSGMFCIDPGVSESVLLGHTSSIPSFGKVSNASLVNSSISLVPGNNVSISSGTVSLGGSTVISVSGTTDHGVLVGNSSGSISSLAVGSSNTVLVGSSGANPSFTVVPNAALANSSIGLTNGNNISFSSNTVSLGSSSTASVSGTTNRAIQVGNASGSLTSLPVPTNGQVLVGVASSNPSWITPTAGSGLSITSNATTLQYALSSSISEGLVKGWVKFNASGVIQDSFNVSSVTKNSTGNFTINWTTPFANTNYCVQVSGLTSAVVTQNVSAQSTTSCTVVYSGGSAVVLGITLIAGAAIDPTFGYVLAIGDQ